VDDEINSPVLLPTTSAAAIDNPPQPEANPMREMERNSQNSKKQSGDEGTAPKRAKGLNSLLETVRQKMAYTIRGI
jgi:hypothetical protein